MNGWSNLHTYMPNGNFWHTFANYLFPLGNRLSDSIKQTVLYIEWYSNKKLISQNRYPLITNVSGEWWRVILENVSGEWWRVLLDNVSGACVWRMILENGGECFW